MPHSSSVASSLCSLDSIASSSEASPMFSASGASFVSVAMRHFSTPMEKALGTFSGSLLCGGGSGVLTVIVTKSFALYFFSSSIALAIASVCVRSAFLAGAAARLGSASASAFPCKSGACGVGADAEAPAPLRVLRCSLAASTIGPYPLVVACKWLRKRSKPSNMAGLVYCVTDAKAFSLSTLSLSPALAMLSSSSESSSPRRGRLLLSGTPVLPPAARLVPAEKATRYAGPPTFSSSASRTSQRMLATSRSLESSFATSLSVARAPISTAHASSAVTALSRATSSSLMSSRVIAQRPSSQAAASSSSSLSSPPPPIVPKLRTLPLSPAARRSASPSAATAPTALRRKACSSPSSTSAAGARLATSTAPPPSAASPPGALPDPGSPSSCRSSSARRRASPCCPR
mmetsp:Transcript_3802/g.11844  ORF Transcript_3802/g.11844 Transcript_3802/m.11844 type:complete len:404 (-) Transcript_3802:183-1394(-)